MISIDTNVLLRYLLQDDERQSAKAIALINGKKTVLVSNVVLAEMAWTLAGKKYKLKAEAIAETIQALFQEIRIVFEHPQTVWRALSDYRKLNEDGASGIDFPDALILNAGKTVARERNIEFGGLYTFDVAAQRSPGTKAP